MCIILIAMDSLPNLALQAIYNSHTKILEINLTDDSFSIIKNDDKEIDFDKNYSDRISEWLKNFALSGNVYSEDVQEFKTKTEVTYIKYHLENFSSILSIRYRRRQTDKYVWVVMEILRSPEYSKDCEKAFLYVRNINQEYSIEIEQQRELEKLCSTDQLTGFNNFYSYKRKCIELEQSLSKKSVGIIFADLNGLKIINDTQGHDKGNEYIINFCQKIEMLNMKDYVYRIGGDEFVFIFNNINKQQLIEKYEKLISTVNITSIPIVSAGYSYSTNYILMEEIIQNAESMMYENKLVFYSSHPEFKREAVEQNYSKEMNAIIINLAKMYPTLCVIDVVNDLLRFIKVDKLAEAYFKSNIPYSEFIDFFINKLIKSESVRLVKKISSIDKIVKALSNQDNISCNFQLQNGLWRQITFQVIEKKNKEIKKIIFYSAPMNQFMVEEMEKEQKIYRENEILEGMFHDFTLISVIDVKSDKIELYKNRTLPDSLVKAINNESYEKVVDWFINTFVVQSDQNHTRKNADLNYILKKLENDTSYSFMARTTPDFHNTEDISYSKFCYYKIKNKSDRIVFVTKNITEETNIIRNTYLRLNP